MTILFYMEFGKKLKQLRTEAGLTQTELAEKAGLKQAIITHYENGLRKPTLEKAVQLAKTLGIKVEEFSAPAKNSGAAKRIHKNSRTVKIQELFEKLPQAKQESVFQIVKGLVG